MPKFGLSQPVRRIEDARFLKGQGRYIDDIAPQGAAHLYILRSQTAHAEIVVLDAEEARQAPGVLAVLTAADLEGIENSKTFSAVKNRDGSDGAKPTYPLLATGRVRYVGQPVAAIVAVSAAAAKDAAERVVFEATDLPVHVETAAGGPQIHSEAPGNVVFDWGMGDEAGTEAAFAAAAHTVSLDLIDNRVIATSMEPRGCHAVWSDGRLHFAFSGQGVWGAKGELASTFGIDPAQVHVTNPDVGGGFGMKAFTYPEYFLAAYAARAVDRPVHWMSERGEAILSDVGGRDHVTRMEAAFDADYKITALRVGCVANMGAYCSSFAQFIPTGAASRVLTGVYDIPMAWMQVTGVFTNTTPIDAYRGAGRPESIYALERLIDHAARVLEVDAIALRRKNFIPRDAFPYNTVAGETYDVGDFDRVLDAGLEKADTAGFAARKAASAAAGKARGLGLCYYIESILGDQNETTKIIFAEDGMVELYVGTQSNGQGHETVFAQFLHERAGIPFDKIRFMQGDSDLIPKGGGTGGSRSVTMQGSSINATADIVVEKFKPLAEEALEVSAADIVFEAGAYRVEGTDKAVTLMDLSVKARAAGQSALLTTEHENTVPGRSFPNGCHIAEVEVDLDTGVTKCVKYTVVDDFGLLVNPMLAEGQVHGGVAQGIGQAITEHVVYDADGQLLSASFMDYAMPRADDVPMMPFHAELVPSTANDIGMKGCGEAGTVGALAAVTNAALDAVWDLGVRRVDMPMTPLSMWKRLQDAMPKAAE
ncbi:MAG: xanthine dehydrogenase family protein molybdopterin-binding subunit [Pseudomonadota bacterium]